VSPCGRGFQSQCPLVPITATTSSGEDAATKRDRQGPVTVTVTLLEASASGIKTKVILETHAGSLDGIVLEQAMSLRAPSGAGIAPAAVEQATGDGHLRQAVVVFPAAAGATELGIVVKNVGGVAERAFRWGVPPAR